MNVSRNKSFKYDVFLSFRGEDTRNTFVAHLYNALRLQGISTFKDDVKLKKGEWIDNELIDSIKDSRFHVIVFSKDYASSRWCLNELLEIMKCYKTTNQTAYPVFYDVEPSEVRKQKGAVEEAFAKHKDNEIAEKWRKALKEAADLGGWELKRTADGNEAKFIKLIVEYISLELRSVNVYKDKNIIGIKSQVKKVLSSLETGVEDVRMIGIKGIGGGGKTTLARAVFDRICTQFQGKSFVQNVGKRSKASLSGFHWLQNQVISDVLNNQDTYIKSYEGKSLMKIMKEVGKVLIVLDDVDDICQLNAIVVELGWFQPGSRIIITTRDEQILESPRVTAVHDVKLLTRDKAILLLSRYAFGTDNPTPGYEKLSHEVVRYADGIPLFITVLGSFLCGRTTDDWAHQLKRLKKMPLNGTQEILELSYIGLENDLKEMFLDIACFMKGWKKDNAIRILESCGLPAVIGLKVLVQKSLITISDDHVLGMNDRIQELGRDIVRRSDCQPKGHSRLWMREEIEEVLTAELGTDATRAIAVEESCVELTSEIVTKGFQNVERLKFLRLISEIEDDCNFNNSGTHTLGQYLPYALQYLSWESYPFRYLPKTFRPNNLVALEMSSCRIVQLWDEESKDLKKLRFLDLSFSKLMNLDLKLTPNLEKLDLEGCRNLVKLDMSNGCLPMLVSLSLSGCSGIQSFSFIKLLTSLKILSLNRLHLKEFPDIIPEHRNKSLLELRFQHNDIIDIPSAISKLPKLNYLDFRFCRKLKSLPRYICLLRHLRTLKLYGCCALEELPENIDHLKCLEKLDLSQTSIIQLPNSLCKLKRLITLNLSNCFDLEMVPGDLGELECLENLLLTRCTRLRDIPDSICKLKHLKYINLFGCIEIEKLPENLEGLECLKVLNVKGTRIMRLPQSICFLEGLKIYETEPNSQPRGSVSTSRNLEAASMTKKRKFHHR